MCVPVQLLAIYILISTSIRSMSENNISLIFICYIQEGALAAFNQLAIVPYQPVVNRSPSVIINFLIARCKPINAKNVQGLSQDLETGCLKLEKFSNIFGRPNF